MNFGVIATIIIAIITSSGLSAIITGWFSKPKVKADAASTLVTASTELMQQLLERLEDTEKKLDEAQGHIDKLHSAVQQLTHGVDVLTKQIEALGHAPNWSIKNLGWPPLP